MKTLYKLDATGSMQEWSISGILDEATIVIQYGKMGGAKTRKETRVNTNSSGRNIREQMILEMKSRISKQIAKGYRSTLEEASKLSHLNELNMYKPMLAQRFDKVTITDSQLMKMYRQYKYDGHRMLVTNTGSKLVSYSRNGKIIDTVDHILEYIDIPENVTIDGELYCHGVELQTIASWAKRKQPNTQKLIYVVYDMVSTLGYKYRNEMLHEMSLGPHVTIADSWKSSDSVILDLHKATDLGYEGLILRHPDMPYGVGKRCKSLVKVKKFLDDEFQVIDIIPSSDNWGILVCQVGENTFKVSAPGTLEDKKHVLENKDIYIGEMINVEYFCMTNTGIPFHPVAKYWRNKNSE